MLSGRTALRSKQVQEFLGVSRRHLADLVDGGEITAIDIAGSDHAAPAGAEIRRRYFRFPVESVLYFVATNMNGPGRTRFLSRFPKETLHALHADLSAIID